MLFLFTLSFSLFFIAITGWTITAYFVKKDSQKFIIEELKNMFDICKMLFVSLKNLISVLARHSFTSHSNEKNSIESNETDEQPLSLVQPIKEIEAPSLEIAHNEDIDTELSSFSPEVVEAITEEEEKVA